MIVALGALAGAAVVVGAPARPAAALPVCTFADGVVTCAFSYTGATEPWVVPDSMLAARVDLAGAGGGQFVFGTLGGAGGSASAEIPSVPGATWWLSIGGAGAQVNGCLVQDGVRLGGFNGGGDGAVWGSAPNCEGASGGGATDLRIGGSTLSDRVLVAGGGGGATNTGCCASGGAGGGAVGSSGVLAGGSIADGSVAGAGGNADGSSGSSQPGVGGDGQIGPLGSGGGGGGGGWYGGAGGLGTAGGGGGSGYGPVGAVLQTGGGSPSDQHGSATVRFPLAAVPQSATPAPTQADIVVSSNSGNGVVDVHVIWGSAPGALSSSTAPIAMGPLPDEQTFTLSGLAPGQTYYYRAITTIDGLGAAQSPLMEFTTLVPTVAADMVVTTDEDQAITTALDATGPDLTFATVVAPAHGTVSYSGGDVTYTPAPNFNGQDTFTYRATSTSSQLSDDGVVTVTVDPIDDPVVAHADTFATAFGVPVSGNVLTNDESFDGPVTASVVDQPANGTLEFEGDGSFVFTPSAGFSGTDTFTYRAVDQSPDGPVLLAVPGDIGLVSIAVAPPPATTSTAPPTTLPPPTTVAPTPPPTAPPTTIVVPALPTTGGSSSGGLLAAAGALLVAGALGLVVARRRAS